MSAGSFGGRFACQANVALFGPSRRGLAAAVRGVTAWRRETEGGELWAVDGWVRSRGVAAPPAAPGRPVVGAGIGSREAMTWKTRGEAVLRSSGYSGW